MFWFNLGNTLNCNHPVVKELILDSLRHWYGQLAAKIFLINPIVCRFIHISLFHLDYVGIIHNKVSKNIYIDLSFHVGMIRPR